ncbi:hypothetical protein BDZ97DRAFT_1903110 [Flammula alnicola]|nr:hypothetical protein BDZ97DRAFT_1903110 [Flammula alnicola]
MSVPPHFLVDHGHASFAYLPFELVENLNQTYFLHLLVTDPAKVVPPGKSLLSMMMHANFKVSDEPKDDQQAAILDRVKEVAHRAFWNEALELLSSPLPSVQLPRLKRLYLDLYEELTPLFPPKHPILVSLSSPLPPTSSPLHSTISLLKEILAALRKRCAPVRDQMIDELDISLSHPPPSVTDAPVAVHDGTHHTTPPTTPLAEFVVDKIKAILALAEDMKADLNTFVLGSMTEAQLRGVLLNEVKMRERQLVLTVWGGQDSVHKSWRSWVDEMQAPDAATLTSVLEDKRWIVRLFLALGADNPVHCHFPSNAESSSELPDKHKDTNGTAESSPSALDLHPEPNRLPPQLLFSTPALIYIQNYIQAIVIAAALRSLTRLPLPSAAKLVNGVEHDFMSRVWTLLKAEIDEDAEGGSGSDTDVGQTKLVNLADEVVRARQRASAAALDPEEEKRLRAAVERTLRSSDPVFLLLRKRLVGALERRVVGEFSNAPTPPNSSIPVRMQTGKDVMADRERAGKRLKLMLPESPPPSGSGSAVNGASGMAVGPVVPGFEEPVLQQAVLDVAQKIVDCVMWTEGVWGALV